MSRGGTIRAKGEKWLWVGYFKDEKGKVHRPSKSFNTKKEAENYRKLQEKENKHISNVQTHTDYTVNDFYLIWQKETRWHTEEVYHFYTTNAWRSQFRKNILPYIGTEKLQNIDYRRLQEFFLKSTLSAKTYKNILSDIKSMLDYAKEKNDDLIIVDNLHKVKIIAKKQPKVKVFNLMSESQYEEIIKMMQTKKLYYTNLIQLLHETGLRIEEALGLKPENIDFENKNIEVRSAIKRVTFSDENGDNKSVLLESCFLKSSSSYRSVPMNEFAKRAIVNQMEMLKEKGIVSQYLFPTFAGKPADARNVLRSFHDTIKACNKSNPESKQMKIRGLHSLRKLYCKYLKDNKNLDWELVSRFMGHSSIDVTKKYYYATTEEDIYKIATMLDASDERLAEERMQRSLEGADGGQAIPYFLYTEDDLIF